MKVIDYKILRDDDDYMLVSEVNSFLGHGWELHGGLSVVCSNGRMTFCQAVVKRESPELAAQNRAAGV